MDNVTRRGLLQLGCGTLLLNTAGKIGSAMENNMATWQMGLIADLHYGLAPDALPRLSSFMAAVDDKKPACILQLGDFNFGVQAEECMQLWQQFEGPKHHVLGNHDMDKATKAEMVDRWGMPSAYYSFDHKGWHFIVLDRNHLRLENREFVDYANANFYVPSQLRGFADPEQLEWLKEDLQRTQLPTVVFAHQGLGIEPSHDSDSATGAIETILAAANTNSHKVKACLCGHHHVDRYNFHAGVHYLWINSASYYWVGEAYGRMAPYTEPLFTFLTFHSDQTIEVAGCDSAWAEPTPQQRGYPDWQKLNTRIAPRTI